MADDVTFQSTTIASPASGTKVATDELADGSHAQQVKLLDGTADATTPIAAGGGVEAGALRVTVASDSTGVLSVDDNGTTLSVDDGGGSLTVDGPLTDAQLRATPVPVSDGGSSLTVDGTVAVSGTVPVSDASGSLTVDDGGLTLSVDDGAGSLTVDGTVTANAGTGPWPVTDNGGSLTVDGPLTDTELRATAVPVSASSLPLPSGAATAAKQPALGTAGTPSADVISIQGVASGTVVPVSDGGGSITVDGTITATPAAAATGGATPFFDSSVDNSGQTMKGSAGSLYFLECQNPNTSDVWLQLFDHASPTVGTTTPKLSLLVPAGTATLRGAMDKAFPVPIAFATAITYAATTTATGNGNPSSALVLNGAYA